MCSSNKHHRTVEAASATTLPYEGATMPLHTPAKAHRFCHHHYWHLLWLVWPMFYLGGWLIETVGSSMALLVKLLFEPVVLQVSLLPLLLIVAGVVLILRNRNIRD
ncbi:MAG: hypothetical protein HC828_08885 [Blastochloris sp.]|nr:hypothetical protein [Blastochloris sp.]